MIVTILSRYKATGSGLDWPTSSQLLTRLPLSSNYWTSSPTNQIHSYGSEDINRTRKNTCHVFRNKSSRWRLQIEFTCSWLGNTCSLGNTQGCLHMWLVLIEPHALTCLPTTSSFPWHHQTMGFSSENAMTCEGQSLDNMLRALMANHDFLVLLVAPRPWVCSTIHSIWSYTGISS